MSNKTSGTYRGASRFAVRTRQENLTAPSAKIRKAGVKKQGVNTLVSKEEQKTL